MEPKVILNETDKLGGVTLADLYKKILYNREALSLCPIGHPDHSMSLDNLGIALCAHYRQLGMLEDCEEAITCHREALSLRPIGHPDRSISLSNLASAVYIRYRQSL